MEHAWGEVRNAHKKLVGKPEANTTLRRFRLRLEDDIKVNLKKIKYESVNCIYLVVCRVKIRETSREGVEWIHVAQDRDR
jgi:hypothetical protein